MDHAGEASISDARNEAGGGPAPTLDRALGLIGFLRARCPWGAAQTPRSLLDGLPRGLDPLSRAHRIQERVSSVGFDWEDARGAFEKVAEELEEVRLALEAEPSPALEEELGDLLFAVVNLTRLAGAHAMGALQNANRKFSGRFEALERMAGERGVALGEASLEELDRLWDEVKRREQDR